MTAFAFVDGTLSQHLSVFSRVQSCSNKIELAAIRPAAGRTVPEEIPRTLDMNQ
jgi:hypothetical protein